MSTTDNPDLEVIGPILGRVPSGIFILTIRHEEQETGMLASWVMQAGFDPPAVTVAVKKDRYVAPWLEAGAAFALNLVSEEGKSLLGHFGRGFEPGQPAFEGLTIDRDDRDLPLLRDGTVGQLICQSVGHVDSGDHRIFMAHVIGGAGQSDGTPMVHIRKSGTHY